MLGVILWPTAWLNRIDVGSRGVGPGPRTGFKLKHPGHLDLTRRTAQLKTRVIMLDTILWAIA
jgi:hypothetical protein